MVHEKQRSILRFWFGDDPLKPLANERMWFSKNSSVDADIRERFSTELESAGNGAYDDWVKTPDGALALAILLDQFSRQIYRGTEQAFAFDERALKTAQIALAHGFDAKMGVVERCFLYLPFEHCERLEPQERTVELFSTLYEEASGAEKIFIAETLDYAVRHREVIQTFGRFPHRNDILGRSSTNAELDFLKTPGARF